MEYPSEAKYMRVKNYNDKVLARHTTRISPFNGSNFGPSNIDRILFNIPSETGMEIDMDSLMFHFDAQIDLGATQAGASGIGYDVMFLNSIESVIQTLRIRKGTSFLLEDIQRYNYLDSMFMNYVSKDYNECFGNAMMGIGPVQDRVERLQAAAAVVGPPAVPAVDIRYNTKKNYCVPFRLSGISNYSGLISTSLIDSVCAFQIEIELAPAADCIQVNKVEPNPDDAAMGTYGSALATSTYILSKCYLTYDVVRMAPEYHQQLQASIQRGVPLQIPYKTWRTSLYSVSGNATSHTFNINDTVKSLNAVFVAFYRQDEQGKLTISGKDRKHKPANLKSVQLQLGSFYYPLQPMDAELEATQCFLELQKALGLAFVRSENTGPFSYPGKHYSKPYPNTSQNLLTPTGGFAASSPTVITNEQGIALNAAITGAGQTLAYKANYAGIGAQDGTNAAAATDAFHRFAREAGASPCTEFLIGFNLRKVLDAVEGEIVGTDIQSSGSGLMTLRLEWNAGGPADVAYNIVIASLYDAVLEIQSNQQTFRVE